MKHSPNRSTRRSRVYLAVAAGALGSLTTVVTHAAGAPPPPPPPSPSLTSGAGDRACLRALAAAGVPFVARSGVRGIRTPVEIVGPIRGVRLVSRGKRPALMDCALARALTDAAPLLHRAGVTGLSFSAAYDYRPMRGSTKLSEHAHGLAIDVHAFETTSGRLEVQRDFSRAGTLRTVARGLQSHPSFRLILTPDDNRDHHDHFHIESRAGGAESWLSDRGNRSSTAGARATTHARRSESARTVRRRHMIHVSRSQHARTGHR